MCTAAVGYSGNLGAHNKYSNILSKTLIRPLPTMCGQWVPMYRTASYPGITWWAGVVTEGTQDKLPDRVKKIKVKVLSAVNGELHDTATTECH